MFVSKLYFFIIFFFSRQLFQIHKRQVLTFGASQQTFDPSCFVTHSIIYILCIFWSDFKIIFYFLFPGSLYDVVS